MERFMPPFASLSDQERWDVVAYAMTLHTSREELEKGKELFEANCANCSADFFKDQAKMSALSEVELARIIKQGNDQVKAFGSNLSDDEVWTVAAYLRTLPFDTASIASGAITPTPEAVTITQNSPVGQFRDTHWHGTSSGDEWSDNRCPSRLRNGQWLGGEPYRNRLTIPYESHPARL